MFCFTSKKESIIISIDVNWIKVGLNRIFLSVLKSLFSALHKGSDKNILLIHDEKFFICRIFRGIRPTGYPANETVYPAGFHIRPNVQLKPN